MPQAFAFSCCARLETTVRPLFHSLHMPPDDDVPMAPSARLNVSENSIAIRE
jgi:hypothetical protein